MDPALLVCEDSLSTPKMNLQLQELSNKRATGNILIHWQNLSGDKALDLGASLAEVFNYEVERIQLVLHKSRTSAGLWNERSNVSLFERAPEGVPTFVRQVELLGLPERVMNLLRLVLLTRPQIVRGTIHRFGNDIRFQVLLDGRRDKSAGTPRVRSWAIEFKQDKSESDKPESIPDVVSELAHQFYLDFMGVQSFRNARSFMYFTRGLRRHLSFNELRGRGDFGREAIKCYKDAIREEGENPLASYAIGQILYSAYLYKQNEEAIVRFRQALRSSDKELRAKAFCGLADAYSQRVHRHERSDNEALEEAIRSAKFAKELSEFCKQTTSKAAIIKALAFATQIQANRELQGSDEMEI
jgi:hypothetical protein